MELKTVPISEIVHSRYSADYSRSYSRETFRELVMSIRAIGIHDPLMVTGKNAEGFYVIIDGDHRLDAAKEAGLETVPLLIDQTVDPDKPSADEIVQNYISNTQRVNMSTLETARLFRRLYDNCNFAQLEEMKKKMGISARKTELLNKLISLDDKTAEWLMQIGMDSRTGLIEAMLSIKKVEDRQDAIARAESLGITEPLEMQDFMKCVGAVLNTLPEIIRFHFNGRELPYSNQVISFIRDYPTEEKMLEAVGKLNSIPCRERAEASAQFERLLRGIDPKTGEIKAKESCPELIDLILHPDFPCDETTVGAIIRFRGVYPEDPDKRLRIISDLLENKRLTQDDLVRLTRSLEKFFPQFPDEVKEFFWDGHLQFSDTCFRILDILLGKTYDLPTKLEMIGNACSGKTSPEQFETRLAKAIKERDDMNREIALQTGTDPADLKNDEDVMRAAGMPEEDIERIRDEKADRTANKDRKKEAPSAPAVNAADDIPQEEEEYPDYMVLADSMAKSQSTDKYIELDLILKGENESMKLSKMYATANATCRFCRTQRVFNFDTINYCDGCMLAHFVGEIEDSVGED